MFVQGVLAELRHELRHVLFMRRHIDLFEHSFDGRPLHQSQQHTHGLLRRPGHEPNRREHCSNDRAYSNDQTGMVLFSILTILFFGLQHLPTHSLV